MRGRKPLPAEVHRANGNPSRRKGRDQATRVGDAGVPVKPSTLDAATSRAWDELAGVMAAGGILDQADGLLLEVAATTLAVYRAARREVLGAKGKRGEGLTAEGQKSAKVAHPTLGTLTRAGSELRQLMDQLGVGPVGRARLGIATGGEAGKDPEKAMDDVVGESGRTRLRAVGGGKA